MKTFLELFFFFLLTAQFSFAQWFWQNPVPQGNTLYALSFCDDNNGTAVGDYGTIIHTTDGGLTWVNQKSGTLEFLRDVSFTDPDNGTIVGDRGIILNTKDGGQTWNAQISGTTETLYGVSFTDANTGTAVGVMGTILRTTDGGSKWTAQSSSITGTYCALLSVSFVDAEYGTIVGSDGIVQRTTDGGNTWLSQNSGATKALSGVSFLDRNNGIAVGTGGTVIRTNDGGENWTLMQVTENSLTDVSFNNINDCLIVGNSQTIVKVTDAGTSWTRYYQVGENNFYGASRSTIVGAKGQIFRYREGTIWDTQVTGPVKKMRGISLTSPSVGTAIGDNGTILRTTDGGSTWISQSYNSPSTNGSINDYPRDVSFSNQSYGLIVTGDRNSDSVGVVHQNGLILRTIDGGTQWNVQYSNANVVLNGVSIAGSSIAFAVGMREVYEQDKYVNYASFCKSTDGGLSWNNWRFTSIKDALTDVTFTDNNVGTVVGHNGRILRTTNSGTDWNTQISGTTRNLYGVCFTDANNGIVVGAAGTILHTSNGGIDWIAQSSGTGKNLYGVHFTDSNNGKVVGSSGTILQTTNGGAVWEIQAAITSEDLFAVHFADENIGNIAGDKGTILRTTNSGITFIEEEQQVGLSGEFLLSQNYPNPFNNSSIIRYSIPELSYVSLKIFNMLGEELQTLVSEEKPAGIYEVNWNAPHLPTGIYFYRLKAGNFMVTRKMILLK